MRQYARGPYWETGRRAPLWEALHTHVSTVTIVGKAQAS